MRPRAPQLCNPAGAMAVNAATITVVNKCSYTVWPAALPGGGVRLDPGQTWPLTMPAGTAAARVWPRTGWTFNGSGVGRCITGDCAGKLACAVSGERPTTIAEYTLGKGGAPDFFDLSLVDGFNVPMRFQPLDGAPCRSASCAVDIPKECLPELRVAGGCGNSCGKLGGDTYCCRGQFVVTCPPTYYSMVFKRKCPEAYSEGRIWCVLFPPSDTCKHEVEHRAADARKTSARRTDISEEDRSTKRGECYLLTAN